MTKKKLNITICYDDAIDTGKLEKFNYNTLEPKLLKENTLENLKKILNKPNLHNEEDLLKYMENNKTTCALDIFDTSESINFPNYILRAIS